MAGSTSRLKPLLDLAGFSARDSALRLAQSLSELKLAEDELGRMRTYLEEYRGRLATTDPVTPNRLENDRHFMSRLAGVIAARATQVEATRARHEISLENWRKTHRHSKALEKLFDTYYLRELAAADRREQEETDELVLRALHLAQT